METPSEISFQQVLSALLDTERVFTPRFLYRFSDLETDEIARLAALWPDVPLWRRRALLEDIEELGEGDTLLYYKTFGLFALQDSDPTIRLNAIHILWEYEDKDLAPIFIETAQGDPDIEVRAAAVSALGRFIYLGEIDELAPNLWHRIEELLLEMVNGEYETLVRRHALESLGYSGRDEVNDLIESAYTSKDKSWIASALLAMGRSANERWHADVLAMLDSNVPALRAEAARAAGELEIHLATPKLIEMLDDVDEGSRLASIWSLTQLGGEGVREKLEELLVESEDDDEIAYLESALDNLSFTEDLQLMPLFDYGSLDDEEDEDELVDLDEELDWIEGDDKEAPDEEDLDD